MVSFGKKRMAAAASLERLKSADERVRYDAWRALGVVAEHPAPVAGGRVPVVLALPQMTQRCPT